MAQVLYERAVSQPGTARSPQDGPPSEGPCLRTGKNPRASQSKAEVSLLRETHTREAECGLAQKTRAAPGCRVVGFYGLSNFAR